MHVLVSAHDFYPDPGSGGTGRYVFETTRRLVERGHRASVVTRRRGDIPLREAVDGVNVYRYDLDIADHSAPTILSQLPDARRVVADHVAELSADDRPDLLSDQGPVTSLLVGRHVADSVPRVPTFHSPWPTEYRIRTRNERSPSRRWANALLRRYLEGAVLGQADRAITLSEYMSRELARVYGPEPPVSVVPGGVDTEQFASAARHDLGPRRAIRGDPSFLTVRRLAERMGHERLLSAFAAVVGRHPAARLYVAGDGPLRVRLERTAARLGIAEATTFLGYLTDDDLPGVYAAADVFVLPTTELEGFGLATLEALAAGTPVVGTPVGGTVEVLSGLADRPAIPEPVLTSNVDAEALEACMLGWAGVSESALTEAGRACREYAVERYPWERTVAGIEAIYRDVVG